MAKEQTAFELAEKWHALSLRASVLHRLSAETPDAGVRCDELEKKAFATTDAADRIEARLRKLPARFVDFGPRKARED